MDRIHKVQPFDHRFEYVPDQNTVYMFEYTRMEKRSRGEYWKAAFYMLRSIRTVHKFFIYSLAPFFIIYAIYFLFTQCFLLSSSELQAVLPTIIPELQSTVQTFLKEIKVTPQYFYFPFSLLPSLEVELVFSLVLFLLALLHGLSQSLEILFLKKKQRLKGEISVGKNAYLENEFPRTRMLPWIVPLLFLFPIFVRFFSYQLLPLHPGDFAIFELFKRHINYMWLTVMGTVWFYYAAETVPYALTERYLPENEEAARWDEFGVSYVQELMRFYNVETRTRYKYYGDAIKDKEMKKFQKTDKRQYVDGVYAGNVGKMTPLLHRGAFKLRIWAESKKDPNFVKTYSYPTTSYALNRHLY